jgi:DNA primase
MKDSTKINRPWQPEIANQSAYEKKYGFRNSKECFYKQNKFVNVDDIKSHINPIGFYEREGQIINPKCRGDWLIAGLCPFHADKSSGSFYVHKEKGAFRCFSCDAKGGDIITFVQKKYEISFLEAIKKIQSEWGIS